MRNTIITHLAAAVATVLAYWLLTRGDVTYIMAMMAMYLWMITAIAATRIWWQERRGKRSDYGAGMLAGRSRQSKCGNRKDGRAV